MEIINVSVEYPSGITITDRGTLISGLDHVSISERLASIIREFSISEAPPLLTGRADGRSLVLEANTDGTLQVASTTTDSGEQEPGGLWSRLVALIESPTKEQRQ